MENQEYTTADTISYMKLIAMVIARKKIVFISVLVFLCGGILLALTSPVEYESSVITISEAEEVGLTGLGQLGGLAGIAGINIPGNHGNKSTVSPEMYPEVVNSRSFLTLLIHEEFFFATKGKNMSLKAYFLDERPDNIFSKIFKNIIGLPSRIINLFSSAKDETNDPPVDETDSRVQMVSSEDEYAIGQLRKRIAIDNDKRFMTLRVRSPEPLISAQLNVIVLDRLIDYVTTYKTEKQRNNLQFIEERVLEAEAKFKESQMVLASFRDANQGIISQKARTREEFLQAEFNVAFNVYNTLKQEVEQARIQLKKETPMFSTFEPAVVPLSKASPNTPLIIIISIFAGLFVGLGLVLLIIIKELYQKASSI
jgi:hypothetical protein